MINSHGCCWFHGVSTTEPLQRGFSCWEDRGCERKGKGEGEIEKYRGAKDEKDREEKRRERKEGKKVK